MVTNTLYQSLINQIALLFCKSNAICKQGVTDRLKNYLTNDLFSKFLQHLERGQIGAHWFKIIKWNFGGVTANVKLYWLNLVNGKSGSVDILNVPKQVLDGGFWDYYNYLEAKLDTNAVTWGKVTVNDKNYAIVYSPSNGSYGISLTPVNAGGGTPTIIPTPQTPPTQQLPTNEAGVIDFDIQALFSNPIVWLGVGVAVYYGLIKRR